jgi:hypothetical protein
MSVEITTIPVEGKEYSTGLHVHIGDSLMSFGFNYFFRVEGTEKKSIEGIIRPTGMSSVNILDDEDADDYMAEKEGESVDHVVRHLQKQYAGIPITGKFTCDMHYTYHQCPREYEIGTPNGVNG